MRSTPEGEDPTTCGTEAPLPPDVLGDVPEETVKALVDCLVITIFLAVTTTTIIGVLHKRQLVYVSRWLSQLSTLHQRQ